MTARALQGRLLGGGYRIGALIGQGAMGAVYEATLERLGRPVAVKLLLGSQGPLPPDQVQRFEREARSAAALGHPNIVQVTDFQWLPGEPPVLVMERLPGESLGAMIERVGALPVELACFLATQILDALSAAHQAGIVHRDIKPDNVCLVPMGAGVYLAKVVDFGVAKLTGEAPITSRGTMVGTPAYMAPEQATGQPVDARTDVYAVGATLYHVLSGRLPIDPNTPIDRVIEQITRVSPPPLTQLVAGIDPQLSAIVARAMAKDIHARFPTAEAFRVSLAPFVRASPSSSTRSVPSHLARSVGPGSVGPPMGPPPGAPIAPYAAGVPGHPPPTSPSPGGWAPSGIGPPAPMAPPAAPYAAFVQGQTPLTAPSPGLSLGPPAGGQTGQPPALPIMAAPVAPPSSRAPAIAAVLVALVLLAAVVGVVLYLSFAHDDAPPSQASKPAKPAASAPANAVVTPSATTDPDAPVPSGSAAPAVIPNGPRTVKKDAGPDDAGPPALTVVDAAVPLATTRVMRRTSANMSPFGSQGMAAIAAVDAQMALFRPCAQTACVRTDKVVRDEPYLTVDVRLGTDANGDAKPAGFAPLLPPGPACPMFEQCITRKLAGLKLPKAEKVGVATFTLEVVERTAK